MKKLLEEIAHNLEFRAKIAELDKDTSSKLDDYLKVAAEYGIEIEEEDFQHENV